MPDISLLQTLCRELENMQILTELLIFSALIMIGILAKLIAITIHQKIITIRL